MANYTGVNPIAALLGGLVQGGGQQFLREREEDRRAQFNAANILLNAGIATGELGSLAGIVDPKFLKSMGLTPEVIGQVDQLLEPIRTERASRLAAQGAQTGLVGAQTGLTGAQTGYTQARTEMERAQAAAIPAESAARTTQAEAARTGAAASMMRAEKELTFEQQMELLNTKIQGQLEETNLRVQNVGRDEADRALAQNYAEAQKNWRQAQSTFLTTGKPDKRTGEVLYPSIEAARNAVSAYNQSALAMNQAIRASSQKYGTPATYVPMYEVEQVKSWIGTTSGYRAKPVQMQEMLGQVAGEGLPESGTRQLPSGSIDLGQEEEIMKRFKKSK